MLVGIHNHAQHGIVAPLISLILTLAAFLYFRGWRIRSASETQFPAWRFAAFMSGLFLLWLALASPLALLDHQLLIVHMLQHLLVMTVAAPLLLLGAPSVPLSRGLPNLPLPRRLRLGTKLPLLIRDVLDNSIFCWLAGTATVLIWHVPALFQFALLSPTGHLIEDTSFLCAGLLFWRPIIRLDDRPPQWSMPLYLFLATLPCDILSAFLTFCDRVVYPNYLLAAQFSSLSPLQDQEYAGAIMWVWVTFAYLVPAILLTLRILAPLHARREHLDPVSS